MLLFWFILIAYNPQNPCDKKDNACRAVDLVIPGETHIYKGYSRTVEIQNVSVTEKIPFDPEGLLGTMSAAATVIFGFLVGRLINFYSENKTKLVIRLLLLGLAAVLAGLLWGQWFMICKPLWTGSYVLYTGGLAVIVLACLIWLMDVKLCNPSYFRPFIAFGSNPLFLFVAASVIAKSLILFCLYIGDTSLQNWIYQNMYQGLINPTFGSFLYAVTFVFVIGLLAERLYRRKIYLKV